MFQCKDTPSSWEPYLIFNIITGNFDVPGGAIDTELAKADKGGNATGKFSNSREVTRIRFYILSIE